MEPQRQRIFSILKRSLTLTSRERKVLLFILVSFLVGDFILIVRKWTRPPLPQPEQIVSQQTLLPSPEALRIDINQAGLEDWIRLPGIGPKKAQAILAKRQELGKFRRIEDLLQVKGIGSKLLERLRPYLKIDTFEQTGGEVP